MGWGDGSHYYAKDPHDATRRDGVARQWEQELLSANPDARTEVERAVKQWSPAIREQLRNETGLRLSTPGSSRTAPVRVVDGLPTPVYDVLKELPALAFLLLSLSEIESARRGTTFLGRDYEKIVRLVPEAAHAAPQEIGNTNRMAEALLVKIRDLQVQEKWKEIHEDLLGAYFFRVPIIHIYWVPIGLVAAALDAPPHVLTVVVLAHELAHAYTHLGSDIDEFRWDTNAFAAADLAIIEGLAEFYCRAVCDNLDAKSVGARAVFEKLQGWSSGPYLAYRRWVEGGGDPGEIIRTTMIECRRSKIVKTAHFESVLGEYRRNLTGQRARNEA